MCIHLSVHLSVLETCDGMQRIAGCVLAFHYPHHGHSSTSLINSQTGKCTHDIFFFLMLFADCVWKLVCRIILAFDLNIIFSIHPSIHPFAKLQTYVAIILLSCVLENSRVKPCLLPCRYLLRGDVIVRTIIHMPKHVYTLLSVRLMCHCG